MLHRSASRRARPSRRSTAVGLLLLASSLTACGDEGSPQGPGDPVEPTGPSSTPTSVAPDPTATPQPVPDGVIDPVALPAGEPLSIDSVVDGTIRYGGRTIETDLPPGTSVGIMGEVDELVVVSGTLPDDYPTRYWAVDRTGHAQLLGDGGYESYNYPAFLVPETGHVWVNYSDRGTGRTFIWQLDVRSGVELLELRNGDEPPPLDPADQAVLDVYRNGAPYPQDAAAQSPDGSLVAATARADGRPAVVVRRAADEVLRIAFARGRELSDLDQRLDLCKAPRHRCRVYTRVGYPVWEDDDHVLVPVLLVTEDRRYLQADVTQSVVVRCDLDGGCDSATGVADAVSLGVDPVG